MLAFYSNLLYSRIQQVIFFHIFPELFIKFFVDIQLDNEVGDNSLLCSQSIQDHLIVSLATFYFYHSSFPASLQTLIFYHLFFCFNVFFLFRILRKAMWICFLIILGLGLGWFYEWNWVVDHYIYIKELGFQKCDMYSLISEFRHKEKDNQPVVHDPREARWQGEL